ncbi:3-phosphoshikimate 1-carboxyvinyltransferase [Flavobacterium sp.]|uniref:3-phosphoshikimate 1-carboxyvinyltransferase n=1 Tax=Flavobacterium sp. TaxID=239 RepID=UPI003751E0CD
MDFKIQNSKFKIQNSKIAITGSKSETNRLLLLQALYPNITLENTSNSDDSKVMVKALAKDCHNELVEVHHAGTAMRFLTAYFAIQEGKEIVLTGSSRMKERPIKILVDAIKQLGADIEYIENDGFPPIKIKGKKITQNKISIDANVSSQYISALLLIAPKLENGLEITLEGEITSIPYIKMTLELLNRIGVETSFENNSIKVYHKSAIVNQQLTIESDWSSASYYYSIVALSEIGTQITLFSFKEKSIQADSILVEIYKNFGVETIFNDNNSITISKSKIHNSQLTTHNLNNSPDIAQTIAVTCFGLGIDCHLTGLHTLKIKETDRLIALKTELTKLGANISVTNDSLTLKNSSPLERCSKDGVEKNIKLLKNDIISISTYQDHRMAMSFAPLALKTSLIIENAEVVSKSYPTYWEDLKSIGFNIILI